MTASAKSLKASNLAWMWSVVALDAIVLVLLAFTSLLTAATLKEFAWVRMLVAGIAPVVMLLLTSLLSADAMAVIVFWRVKETLPGHRAFSFYAPKDSRISLDTLRKNIGSFPDDPKEQNTLWLKLYEKVESDVTVAQANCHYLLFRDLAAMSLLLVPIATLAQYLGGAGVTELWITLALLVTQYGATAIAARNSGVRFVTNVLALYSVKRRV